MQVPEFLWEMSQLKPSSTFLVIHKYRNDFGELADFNILFHISYKSALKKSLQIMSAIVPENQIQFQAQQELIASYSSSLERMEITPVQEIDDQYLRFQNDRGQYVKGCRVHKETGIMYLYGLLHQKKIIEPGIYKQVNSSPLTLAKQFLSEKTPVNRFRHFRLHPSKLEKIKIQQITLLPPDPLWQPIQ